MQCTSADTVFSKLQGVKCLALSTRMHCISYVAGGASVPWMLQEPGSPSLAKVLPPTPLSAFSSGTEAIFVLCSKLKAPGPGWRVTGAAMARML